MTTTVFPMLLMLLLACATLPAEAMQATPGVPSPTPGPPVHGVDVARDTLDGYAGTYVISPGFEVRVWREGDAFLLQVTGQHAWPLIAESESLFVVPAMQARISFGSDARGTTTHLVMYVDGKETRALRR